MNRRANGVRVVSCGFASPLLAIVQIFTRGLSVAHGRHAMPNAIPTLAPADLLVIGAYLVLVSVIGVRVARRTHTGDDLFLAGRTLGWGAIGLSLFASNISTTTLIGLSGAAYADGIAVSAYEWLAGVPLIVLAFVFVPMFLRARITTIPEYLEIRYSRSVRLYFSAVTILLTVLVDTAGGLYAGAIVLQTYYPTADLWVFCLIVGLFAGIYTAAGGLKAVVYTDVLQAVVLIVGCSVLTLLLFGQFGFSLDAVRAATPADHFSIVKPIDDPQLPWPGLAMGVVLLGFWYWVTNQYIVQRVLGAKDLRNAQQGAMFAGALKLLPIFIMVMPGAMAISLYPDIPSADMVFPTLITRALPAGLTGLVLAGLIAAIMSSVDSTLNSSSTLVVHDFIRKPGREISPEATRRYGQLATIVIMALAIAWAPLIEAFSGLWSYLQQAFAVVVPPVVAIFLAGAFSRTVTARGALLTLAIGHALGVALFIAREAGWWPVHFTITVFLMTLVSFALLFVLSRGGERPSEHAIGNGVWRPELAIAHDSAGSSFGILADLRVQAALVLAGMAATLIAFW